MGAYFVPKHMHALCHWWLYDEDSFVGFLFSAHFVYDNGGFEQEQEPHHLGSNHSSTTDKFHDFEEITLKCPSLLICILETMRASTLGLCKA